MLAVLLMAVLPVACGSVIRPGRMDSKGVFVRKQSDRIHSARSTSARQIANLSRVRQIGMLKELAGKMTMIGIDDHHTLKELEETIRLGQFIHAFGGRQLLPVLWKRKKRYVRGNIIQGMRKLWDTKRPISENVICFFGDVKLLD